MSNGDIPNIQLKYNIMFLALGTTSGIPLDYDPAVTNIPTESKEYVELSLSETEISALVKSAPIQDAQKLSALKGFSSNLAENSRKADPEIQTVINNHLWDIL